MSEPCDRPEASPPATLAEALVVITRLGEDVRLWRSWSRLWERRAKESRSMLAELIEEGDAHAAPNDTSKGPHRWPWT